MRLLQCTVLVATVKIEAVLLAVLLGVEIGKCQGKYRALREGGNRILVYRFRRFERP